VAGSDGDGDVLNYNCDGGEDQEWTFYENGEIVNRRSGRCLDVSGTNGSGNVGTYYCDNLPDQKWYNQAHLDRGEWHAFVSYRSDTENERKCLDVAGTSASNGSGVGTWRCDGYND